MPMLTSTLKNSKIQHRCKPYNSFKRPRQYCSFLAIHDEAKSAISSNELKQAALKLDLADTLNEDPNTVLFYRAELAKQAGQLQNAMNLYKQVLKDDPLQQPTLRAMLELTASDGNYARSHRFYNGLTRQQQALIAEDYTSHKHSN